MEDKILVSVIIPFYKGREWLIFALDSVYRQTHRKIEIILIDDGSPENIDDIIEKYNDIIYIKIKNSGPAIARNKGIEIATGEYVCFLDADDVFLPQKIEKQLHFLIESNYRWSSTDYSLFYDGSDSILRNVKLKKSGDIFKESLLSCKIATPTVMIKKEILDSDKNLKFAENTRFGEDTLFWYSLLSKYPLGNLNEELTKVRLRGSNAALSAKNQISAKAYIYNYMKKNNYKILDRKIPGYIVLYYRFANLAHQFSFDHEFFSKIIYLPIWLLFKSTYIIKTKL